MAQCPNCGSEVEEGAKFCGECGQSLVVTQQPKVQVKKKRGKRWIWIILGILASLLVLCVVIIMIMPSSDSETTPTAESVAQKGLATQLSDTPTSRAKLVSDTNPTPTATFTPMPTKASTATLTPTKIPTSTPKPGPKGTAMTGVNLRAGPSTDYDKIGVLAKGDELEIQYKNDDGNWYQARLPSGDVVWVAVAYIAIETGSDEIPTAPLSIIPPTPTGPPPTNTPTVTPTASPTPESSFGKWFYSGKAAAGVTKIDRRGELGIWTPSSGYVFVSVAISYGNRGESGTVHCNPFHFEIKTEDGVIYSPSLATLEPDLKAVDLAPEGKTSGWVTFEIPAAAKDLTLLWTPGSLFASTVEIPLR